MNLHEYLSSEGALTVAHLRERIGAKSDAQVRQWQHGYADRKPSPEYCVAIERATGGKVRRWDLRPEDWPRVWPELIGTEGAPSVPQAANAPAKTFIHTPTYHGPDRRASNQPAGGRRAAGAARA
jgi:DNA-binding transcriptional regulator YdaS (Cro superfamily)